jgi:fructose-1,6-bisphosphatase/inositol monophosphatase family enzyme
MDASGTLAVFDEVIAAVGRALDTVVDLSRRGERAGQYHLDLVVDEAVVPLLEAAGFGVLSEESGRHHPDRDVCVVIDPVDGSTNHSRGIPFSATSLAAVDAEGIWVAAVANLATGTAYRAVRGGGATRDGEPISVAGEVDLASAIVAVNGRGARWPEARQFRTLGAAALELCLVADGSLDGYVNLDHRGHGPWDYLGGLLVLSEAGGVFAEADGLDPVVLDHDARRTLAAASGAALMEQLVAH